MGKMAFITELVQNLENNIKQFEADFPSTGFEKSDLKQHPDITLLTCADSRMPATIFGPIFNRIFSVENIGNQYENNAGSVLYGLLHLKTPLLIIAGHTDCGAIKGALSDFSNEPLPIKRELSSLRNVLEDIKKTTTLPTSEAEDIQITKLAELNLDRQINNVLTNEEVNSLVTENQLLILGVMADLHNIYQNGYGKIYISNYNGVNNIETIKYKLPKTFNQSRIKRLS